MLLWLALVQNTPDALLGPWVDIDEVNLPTWTHCGLQVGLGEVFSF